MRRVKTLFGVAAIFVAGLALSPMAHAQGAPASPPPAPPVNVPPSGPAYPPGYGAPPAYAQPYEYPPPPPPEPSRYHMHDGLYLNARAGIGFASLSSTQAGVKTTLGGGGGTLGAAIGGTIAHNLILYGAFFGTDVSNPDEQVGGTSMNSSVSDLQIGAFGGGVAYYFDPINLYLAGTLGLIRYQLHDSGGFEIDSSKAGLGLELEVGKEWWVSPQWGLGVGAAVFGGSMKDQNQPGVTWSAGGLSLLFSATYN